MIVFQKAAAVVLALAGPAIGHAATLGLTPAAVPAISGTAMASNDVLGFSLDGTGGSSTAPAAASGLGISIFGDLSGVSASLFVTEGLLSFLEGDLLEVGYVTDSLGEDTLELLYGNLAGSAALSFGSQVLLLINGELGDDHVFGFGSFFDPVYVTYQITPVAVDATVPLPPGSVLLCSALAAGALARRAMKAWVKRSRQSARLQRRCIRDAAFHAK